MPKEATKPKVYILFIVWHVIQLPISQNQLFILPKRYEEVKIKTFHFLITVFFYACSDCLKYVSLQRKAAEKAEKPARKTKKDPNAPKRALSAYMFFSQDWRERIKTENPDAGFGQC